MLDYSSVGAQNEAASSSSRVSSASTSSHALDDHRARCAAMMAKLTALHQRCSIECRGSNGPHAMRRSMHKVNCDANSSMPSLAQHVDHLRSCTLRTVKRHCNESGRPSKPPTTSSRHVVGIMQNISAKRQQLPLAYDGTRAMDGRRWSETRASGEIAEVWWM